MTTLAILAEEAKAFVGNTTYCEAYCRLADLAASLGVPGAVGEVGMHPDVEVSDEIARELWDAYMSAVGAR